MFTLNTVNTDGCFGFIFDFGWSQKVLSEQYMYLVWIHIAVNIVFFENFWVNLTVFTQVLITHKALQAKHLVGYMCIYIYIIIKYNIYI